MQFKTLVNHRVVHNNGNGCEVFRSSSSIIIPIKWIIATSFPVGSSVV